MNLRTKPMQSLKKSAVAVAAVFACASAQAETLRYSFGSQIDSPYSTVFQPADTFATLYVTTNDYMNYVFDLYATTNFNSLFGSATAGINRVVFNTGGVNPIASSVDLLSGGNWGVDGVYLVTNNSELGGVTFSFTEGFYSLGSDLLLTAGERVAWTTSFSAPTAFATPPFALKVFGFGADGTDQAFYVPNMVTPVPEPETYGMLLAGLGMLGFVARRRKMKAEKQAA
jgi:PEP-CTERM motif